MLIPGLVSITFRSLSPEEIIAAVSENGLSAVEWGGDVHVPHGDTARAREVAARSADAGLTVAAYGSYYKFQDIQDSQDDAAGPAPREQQGPSQEAVLDTAEALGAPVIRIWAGTEGSAETDVPRRRAIVEATRRMADGAAARGIRIAFEYHGNTLTDSNDSARGLLEEIDHPNVGSLWQPPNGASYDYCLDGLRGIRPYLSNIHCFHWGPEGSTDKRPLAEGRERWSGYLREVGHATPREERRYVLIEFVHDGSLAAFAADAATLRAWLAEVGE
jgi:sugar phosphate isomerase/epimerase